MSRDDGGPAFGHGNPTDGGSSGMSLRDWFAGQIVAAIYSGGVVAGSFSTPEGRQTVADLAYLQADAMLAARRQEPKE